jgi:hypothetical protein
MRCFASPSIMILGHHTRLDLQLGICGNPRLARRNTHRGANVHDARGQDTPINRVPEFEAHATADESRF